MDLKKVANLWQLGIAAGMLFGFGSNAMELVPAGIRVYVKAGLIIISGALILAGYSQFRQIQTGSDESLVSLPGSHDGTETV